MDYKAILLNLIANLQVIGKRHMDASEKARQADIKFGESFYLELDDAIADAFGVPQENIPDFDPKIPFEEQWDDDVHFCRDAITTAFISGTSTDVIETIKQLLEEESSETPS